jgi:hypothetical protein
MKKLEVWFLPSTIGVIDLALVNGVDGVLLHVNSTIWLGGCDNCRISALRDDGNSLSLGVLLWNRGQSLCDFGDGLGLQTLCLCPGSSLGLVSNHIIPVWRCCCKLVLEELANEWSRQRQNEDLELSEAAIRMMYMVPNLVFGCSLFCQSLDRWWTHG